MVIFYLINYSNALIRGQLKLVDALMAGKFHICTFEWPLFSACDAATLTIRMTSFSRMPPTYKLGYTSASIGIYNETNGIARPVVGRPQSTHYSKEHYRANPTVDGPENEWTGSVISATRSFIRSVSGCLMEEYLWYWWWLRNEWTNGLWIDDLLDWFNFYPESATGCPLGLLFRRIALCIIPFRYEEAAAKATPDHVNTEFCLLLLHCCSHCHCPLPPGSRNSAQRMNEIPTDSPSHSSKWPILALLRRV